MGAYGRLSENLEPIFLEVLENTRSVIITLYRRNAMGEYVPVFWVPRVEGSEPSHVASASDVASFLRGVRDEPFEMDSATFKDGPVRRGLQAFGVSRLLAIPLLGEASGRYFLTAGTTTGYREADREVLESLSAQLSAALRQATLSARVRGGTLPTYGDEDSDISPSNGAFASHPAPFSLLSLAVEEGSFSKLVHRAAELVDLDGPCVSIEDADGLVLASHGLRPDDETTSRWLALFPRLPYLDWMEDSHQPVFVPTTGDPNGLGRLVAPVFGRKNYHGLVSVYPITHDEVRANAQIFTELKLAAMYLVRCREASRSHVLRRSLASVENERARIAIELHDETSQNLVALKVRLATAQQALARGSSENAVGIIDDCSRISDEILDGVNGLAADLRPSELAYLGLRPAIEAAAEARLSRVGIGYHLVGNATEAHFGALAERMLLTGVIEALSNCARHSLATEVEIEMNDEGGWFTIAVRDNGRGYTPSEGGVGIKTMRDCSRALGGDFWIGSDVGTGTTVRFSVSFSHLEGVEGE